MICKYTWYVKGVSIPIAYFFEPPAKSAKVLEKASMYRELLALDNPECLP